jgi:hypothetical protein
MRFWFGTSPTTQGTHTNLQAHTQTEEIIAEQRAFELRERGVVYSCLPQHEAPESPGAVDARGRVERVERGGGVTLWGAEGDGASIAGGMAGAAEGGAEWDEQRQLQWALMMSLEEERKSQG